MIFLNSHNMTVALNQEKVENVKFWINEECSKNVINYAMYKSSFLSYMIQVLDTQPLILLVQP